MTRQDSELLRLLELTTAASNDAHSLDAAARVCLDEVCRVTGWPVGHLYVTRPEAASLEPTRVWSLADPARYRPFCDATERLRLPSGVGLPGRVLATGRALWIADSTRDDNFPRAAVASTVGLRAGLGFPILIGSAVVGVLEFFAAEAEKPDDALLQVLGRVGEQLGRVFERERASEALRESALRFSAVAHAVADAIIVADLNGRIVFWNDAAERMFGYSAFDIIGEPLTRLMPERFHAAYAAGLARVRGGAESPIVGRPIELTALRRDGAEFPVELSFSTWSTQDQRFFSGTIRDISERTARQLRERAQEARMQESAKMAALGRLARGIAHDFNNILTAIAGNAEIAQIGLAASDPRGELLSAIRNATESGARLTAQLLAFGRPAPLQTAPIDLNAIVASSIGMLNSTFGADVRVDVDLDPALPAVDAAAGHIEQIVMNLALNARDALPNGGRIEVRTQCLAAEGSDTPLVRLTVADNGDGIPADVLPRIFEPFYTTKGQAGTGLGLATVYAIAAQHGGRVSVESTPGAGATFHVDLPLTRDGVVA